MKKIKTIKLNYEFKNVFSRGKYYFGKQVITYIYKNKYDYNRLGIAINTKLCKAVKRNRIKRVIRACYNDINKSYNLKKGYDIVYIWNKKEKIDNLSYKIIYNDIIKTYKKVELINEEN